MSYFGLDPALFTANVNYAYPELFYGGDNSNINAFMEIHTEFAALMALDTLRNFHTQLEQQQILQAYQIQQNRTDRVSWYTRVTGSDRNFLVYNILSSQWKADRIRQAAFTLPGIYLCGIVGYALSLPIRIAILAITLFKLILTFINYSSSRMQLNTRIFLAALGELGSAFVGLLCPPAAYKIDEMIQSDNGVHHWYASQCIPFSMWRYIREGRETGGEGLGGPANQLRIKRKVTLVKDQIPHFKKAKAGLEKYVQEDEMLMPLGLQANFALGLLYVFAKGAALEIFRDEAIDKCREAERPVKSKEMNTDLAQFKSYWNAVIKNQTSSRQNSGFLSKDKLVKAIKYDLILSQEQETWLQEGKKQQLENKLNRLVTFNNTPEDSIIIVEEKQLTLKEAIHIVGKSLYSFAGNIYYTDNDMCTGILGKINS